MSALQCNPSRGLGSDAGAHRRPYRRLFQNPLSRRRIFYVYGPFVVDDPTATRAGRAMKSTPETLTTACHAASWLARSWRCGWRCTSIGPENFPLAEAKNCPERSVPNFDAWMYRLAAVSGV